MIRDETSDLGSGQRREEFIGHSKKLNIRPRSKGFKVLQDFTKGVNKSGKCLRKGSCFRGSVHGIMAEKKTLERLQSMLDRGIET